MTTYIDDLNPLLLELDDTYKQLVDSEVDLETARVQFTQASNKQNQIANEIDYLRRVLEYCFIHQVDPTTAKLRISISEISDNNITTYAQSGRLSKFGVPSGSYGTLPAVGSIDAKHIKLSNNQSTKKRWRKSITNLFYRIHTNSQTIESKIRTKVL